MSKVTLGYWRVRGRGQVPRLLLVYTGAIWEDVQYTQPQQWFGADRQTLGLQFPNLPYLIEGDFKLTQTPAICNYIADRSKKGDQLLGKNVKQRTKIQSVNLVMNQILDKFIQVIYDPQGMTKKDSFWKDSISTKLKYFSLFKGNKEWLFDRLTISDFFLVELSYYVEAVYPNQYKGLVFLQQLRNRFLSIPEIKTYYEQQWAIKGPFTNMQQANVKF